MNKAVFLDRDGVINDGSLYYTYKIQDFIINQGVVEGLRILQNAGFMLIVISNQSGVAKGEYTCADVDSVHAYMIDELKKNGVHISDIFYCPHHPSIMQCQCRKPGTQLFEQAIEKHHINVTQSYMIGDSNRDIEAAEKMNITGYKIEKNQNIIAICEAIRDIK